MKSQKNTSKKLYKVYWLFILLIWIGIIGIIFAFSHQTAQDSRKLSSFIKEILREEVLLKSYFAKIPFVRTLRIRKKAHVLLYAGFGVITYLFVSVSFDIKKKKRTLIWSFLPFKILISNLLCFLYACADEYHQSFIPGRAGMIGDIKLDAVGFVAAILVTSIVVNSIKIIVFVSKFIYFKMRSP